MVSSVVEMADEATIDAWVEDTAAPYADLLPADALEDMRFLLGALLASHPVASQLVEELRPRTPRVESGVTGDAEDPDEAANGEPR